MRRNNGNVRWNVRRRFAQPLMNVVVAAIALMTVKSSRWHFWVFLFTNRNPAPSFRVAQRVLLHLDSARREISMLRSRASERHLPLPLCVTHSVRKWLISLQGVRCKTAELTSGSTRLHFRYPVTTLPNRIVDLSLQRTIFAQYFLFCWLFSHNSFFDLIFSYFLHFLMHRNISLGTAIRRLSLLSPFDGGKQYGDRTNELNCGEWSRFVWREWELRLADESAQWRRLTQLGVFS